MPWRLQAMKDVAACEKLRGAGKRALIRRYPNGETRPTLNWLSRARVVHAKATLLKRAVEAFACTSSARKSLPLKRAWRSKDESQLSVGHSYLNT